ncbi:glucose PTS transporter transcription antiterminator GlcT [Bacillus sp. FJAT-44742]|uniref:glucose PTS transporter transcription antiterminator GlcT n=1 Tax=Bacillus sp. FJAT-44742 TaxID=2014005 RepID=UPI000C2493ED|nr:transcription antiterminator [Bacillus sp. FJAT-44742]
MKVLKVLNNNVVIAEHEEFEEVILTGKGIGFGKRTGDSVGEEKAEKFFILHGEEEQEQYKQLLNEVSEDFIACMNEAMSFVKEQYKFELNEHIHIGLTDHLFFAVRRLQQGMEIKNPFLQETELAYPKEYAAAEEIIEYMNRCLGVSLPKGEIGFVTLHLHSAVSNRSLSDVNKHTQLVSNLTEVIEKSLNIELDPKDMNHQRLIRHLHQAIQRIQNNTYNEEEPHSLKKVLMQEYPVCYNLSWKLIKIMQHSLQTTIPDSEAVYLTLHMQRLSRTK